MRKSQICININEDILQSAEIAAQIKTGELASQEKDCWLRWTYLARVSNCIHLSISMTENGVG